VALVTLALVIGAGLGLTAQSPSFGHNAVLETTPAAGETISVSPVDIRIRTNDTLLDLGGTAAGFAIIVQDQAGLHFGDGCVSVGETDFSTQAELGAAGEYRVTYQFVSADGHGLSDSFSFDFAPDASHTPASGSAQAPQCAGAGREESDSDETTATDVTTTPGTVVAEPTSDLVVEADEPEQGVVTVAIAAVLIVISLTLLVWMVRRRNGR
jgi:methionine-rich copper-binding protein CopC